MLISELKEKLSQNKTLGTIIEIKIYLPVDEKKIIVDNIIQGCVETDENSIIQINYFNKKLIRDVSLIVNFTNLEFSDDNSILEYDYLAENKIIDWIIDKIDEKEINFIDDLLKDELNQKIKIGNSLENIVAKALNNLISKIPDEKKMRKLMNDIPKSLNKVKPENLEILKGFIGQNKVN